MVRRYARAIAGCWRYQRKSQAGILIVTRARIMPASVFAQMRATPVSKVFEDPNLSRGGEYSIAIYSGDVADMVGPHRDSNRVWVVWVPRFRDEKARDVLKGRPGIRDRNAHLREHACDALDVVCLAGNLNLLFEGIAKRLMAHVLERELLEGGWPAGETARSVWSELRTRLNTPPRPLSTVVTSRDRLTSTVTDGLAAGGPGGLSRGALC